jgi:hypothetical protein
MRNGVRKNVAEGSVRVTMMDDNREIAVAIAMASKIRPNLYAAAGKIGHKR